MKKKIILEKDGHNYLIHHPDNEKPIIVATLDRGEGPFKIKSFDPNHEKVLIAERGLASTIDTLPKVLYESARTYAEKLSEISDYSFIDKTSPVRS